MKKLITMICAAVIGFSSACAQSSVFNNTDNKGYFGIRLAGDIVCPGEVSSGDVSLDIFKVGGGVELGAIYNAPVVANFYIEPGLKLFYNTYSVKKDILDIYEGYYDITSISYRKFGMRIPVQFGYHFDFAKDLKLSVFTGPELEIGLSNKCHGKFDGHSESVDAYGDEGSMHRVNVLWNIGAGVTYDRYYFGVTGAIGMCNMLDDDNIKFHESRVSISLGYNF